MKYNIVLQKIDQMENNYSALITTICILKIVNEEVAEEVVIDEIEKATHAKKKTSIKGTPIDVVTIS